MNFIIPLHTKWNTHSVCDGGKKIKYTLKNTSQQHNFTKAIVIHSN